MADEAVAAAAEPGVAVVADGAAAVAAVSRGHPAAVPRVRRDPDPLHPARPAAAIRGPLQEAPRVPRPAARQDRPRERLPVRPPVEPQHDLPPEPRPGLPLAMSPARPAVVLPDPQPEMFPVHPLEPAHPLVRVLVGFPQVRPTACHPESAAPAASATVEPRNFPPARGRVPEIVRPLFPPSPVASLRTAPEQVAQETARVRTVPAQAVRTAPAAAMLAISSA